MTNNTNSRYANTSLSRPVDFAYPSNRYAIGMSVLAFVGVAIYYLIGQQAAIVDSLFLGLGAAGAAFLAWAIGRELDPDYNLSAGLAAPLAVVGFVGLGLPNFFGLVLLMWSSRMVARTVGLPMKTFDSTLILMLTGLAIWQGSWIFGLTGALVFFLDSRLHNPDTGQAIYAIFALILTFAIPFIDDGFAGAAELTMPYVIGVGLVAVLYASLIVRRPLPVVSVGDATGEKLNLGRVQAAQAYILVVLIGIAFWHGDAGVVLLLPVWAVILSMVINRLLLIFKIFPVKPESTP